MKYNGDANSIVASPFALHHREEADSAMRDVYF
jgi:hypothetical protein